MTASPSPTPAAPPPFPIPFPTPEDHPGIGDLVGVTVELGEARYVLERFLAAGGMGEVYVASRVVEHGLVSWRQSERVAVKVVRRDLASMFGGTLKPFVDEARLHLCLEHPNIVRVHGVSEQKGTLFLVMEYLEGSTLRTLLKVAKSKGQRLSQASICNILAQIADALDYAHRATDREGRPLRIVHRDVTPSNIHITLSGEVKLMDFGVAWSTLEGRLETRTSASGFQGKLNYLSPEQVSRQPLDGRSDLFALGCVLVEALIGRKLFDGHPLLVLHEIQAVTPEYVEAAIRELPEGLKAICHKLLARNPADRYATGKEAAEALRTYAFQGGHYLGSAPVAEEVALLKQLPESPEPPPFESPTPVKSPRRSILPASVALLVVVAGALAYFGRPEPLLPLPESAVMPLPSSPEPAVMPDFPNKPARSLRNACVGAGIVGVLAATSACQVHVRTNTLTGDCSGSEAPVKTLEGHPFPSFLRVYFVSLDGAKCSNPKGTPPVEPCPAGDGSLVMEPKFDAAIDPDPDEIFRGALLFGQSHVVAERGTTHFPVDPVRETTGRMRALFTTLQLSDGTKVPVCGVLYDDEASGHDMEGIAVLDPKYHQRPSLPTTATATIRFFWP